MFHARLFQEHVKYRDQYFQPTKTSLVSKEKSSSPAWLDGNPEIDRPLFVQFCANKPEEFLEAAQYVAPYCDAVDLNLGCPQGIARAGRYGAFLQEDWDGIYKLINTLHNNLSVPVTAKMRILDTREKTLEYAKMILSAGASILTVHGRRREQKGHNTGLADWSMIRYLRDNLPPETVLFANGNILNYEDLKQCMDATGVDGVMSAEGNLSDPTIFAEPPKIHNPREYWYGTDGRNGYRLDAVFRTYLDIIYKYVLEKEPPPRAPLYIPGDPKPDFSFLHEADQSEDNDKKRKRNQGAKQDPNLKALQGHLFQLLRPMLSKFTNIRDALASARVGEMPAFERVLAMVEQAVMNGLDEVATTANAGLTEVTLLETAAQDDKPKHELKATAKVIAQYKRPWWVCQPHIRPLPEDAVTTGALTLKKKAKAEATDAKETIEDPVQRIDEIQDGQNTSNNQPNQTPQAALVCG
jgi:tRNA-dihydrouridine synthase 1